MFFTPVLRNTHRDPTRVKRSFLPRLEALEDRLCPSGGYLLVSSVNTDSVLRYDETTGAFVDTFVPPRSGGLAQPCGLVFGPDHNLYVSSGIFSGRGHRAVLRYDGTAGAFLDDFADDNQLTSPRMVLFGPDGNLYVDDGNQHPGTVLRYNGITGAFMDDFVPTGSGGLSHPTGMVFGPDGQGDGKLDLYVSSAGTNSILRYDGTTGAFLGAFVPSGSGGLDHPRGLVIGPDGNLYVVSGTLTGGDAVLRFQGPTGPAPGAFLGTFVAVGSGGLVSADTALLFGPDGKKDGKLDLYVGSCQFKLFPNATVPGTNEVLRYDGTTGAFVDVFVGPDSGGLDCSTFGLTFTETDPTTLNYVGPMSDPTLPAATALAQPATGTRAVVPVLDSTVVALQKAAPSAAAWPGSQQATPSLTPRQSLAATAADFPPLSAGRSPQTVAASGRVAAHGTPSTVLDRVFADLDASLLLDTLPENRTPGPTG
jgi:hypothetical protein